MRKSIPIRASWPLRALVTVFVAAFMCIDLAAEEPASPPRPWRPLPAVPPRGPFFGGQAFPNPIPVPMPMPIPVPNPNPFPFPLQPQYPFQLPNGLPPGSFELGATGSTDRCLVIASGNDPGSIKTADTAIDSGIFARPKVHGLPIQPPRWVPGRLRRNIDADPLMTRSSGQCPRVCWSCCWLEDRRRAGSRYRRSGRGRGARRDAREALGQGNLHRRRRTGSATARSCSPTSATGSCGTTP